jgi:hypothetical protein
LAELDLLEACAAIVGRGNAILAAADKAAFEHDVWSRYQSRAAFVVRPSRKS